jgi:imidazoleglycerol-phosphate dehydratase
MAEKRAEREGSIARKTGETDITLRLVLDGTGQASVSTGIGFFNHMLTLATRHALFDLEISARGDLAVDGHHTVEDVGICLGAAFAQAVGDKAGMTRYGCAYVPMDEALARVALDVSGRGSLAWRVRLPGDRVGFFDACLAREFFRAFAVNARLDLHADLLHGEDIHHCLEALFKGLGRALRQAAAVDPREVGGPSTKGAL